MTTETKRYISQQTYYLEQQYEELLKKVRGAQTVAEAVAFLSGAQRAFTKHTGNIRKKIEFGEE